MYLQNPFENDDGFGIDLKKRLDFEIWKSSYMISKSSIPSDLTDYWLFLELGILSIWVTANRELLQNRKSHWK